MNILSRLVNLVYPSKCSFCGKLISFQKSGINICSECMDKIKFCASRKRCKVCGTPLGNPRYRLCQSCFRKAKSDICTYYNGITAAVEYDRNSKRGIINLKHARSLSSVNTFSNLITAMVKNDFGSVNFDYITAIPPRRQRMKEIGFDQSGALAKKTAKLLSVKYYPNLFKRIRQTSKQTELSSFERQQNQNGAFGLKGNSGNIKGKTILVIDDVTTTGATFNECARVLKLSGAKAVYCAAIATTEKNNGDRDSFT